MGNTNRACISEGEIEEGPVQRGAYAVRVPVGDVVVGGGARRVQECAVVSRTFGSMSHVSVAGLI